MLSFKAFINQLLEALEPLPGKNRGWVDYQKIDGNHVHVRYKHTRGGRYTPQVTVNGKFHKEEEHEPRTNLKIAQFVKHSTEGFIRDVKPVKLNILGNTPKKAKVYKQFARNVAPQEFKYKEKEAGAVLVNKANKSETKYSGYTARDASNPAHERPARKKGWKGEFKGDKFDKKTWKKKADAKSDLKSGKFHVKKGIKSVAGGGGDFGGGGSSGSW